MALEMDPDKINDPERDADRQLEARILDAGNAYSASHKRSRTENKARAKNRADVKEMGLRTDAYQVGVRIVKDLTESERKAFLSDLNLVVRVLGAKQAELFPDEALRAAAREKRAQERAAGKGRTKEELDAKTNADKRSDPANGGAKPQTGDWPDDKQVAERDAGEQAAGDAALAAAAPKTSQSQAAAKKRAAAGLN